MIGRSPRRQAIGDMRSWTEERIARDAAEAVFYRLSVPDRLMLETGAAELQHALPPGTKEAYARNLAACVWRAMLEAAR